MQSANDNLKTDIAFVQGHSGWAGILGWPVHHSKSPLIHGYWLREYGLSGTYVPLPCPEGQVSDLLDQLEYVQESAGNGCRGLNVTVPHKETVFDYLSQRILAGKTGCLSTHAHMMGAVNTVYRQADGSWFGDNSDGYGFIQNLRQMAPDFQFKDQKALILGAGGAARAIIVALLTEEVATVTILNRTIEKAEKIKTDLMAHTPALADKIICGSMLDLEDHLSQTDLCVNTTSLGMTGQAELNIDLSPLPKSALVTDIVYNPLKTDLLRQAEALDLAHVDGIGMLLHQARLGFHHWFGTDPHVTPALRQFILKHMCLSEES